jgi:hypothetical protein
MFAAWHSRSNMRAVPHRQRAVSLRPQVEMLEDRLAPSATLRPVPLGTLPPVPPVIDAAWDASPTTHQTSSVLSIDLVALGLSGASRIEIVFHTTPNPLALPALQYFDAPSHSWRPVQGSTQVADSLVVNADQGTITVTFDATSNPALANLQGALFRLADSGILTSAIPVASVSQAPATIFQSVDAVFALPHFDPLPLVPTDTRPLDDHGVGLYYVDHATIDVVATARSALGQTEEQGDVQPASASEPPTPQTEEPLPPMDPKLPESTSTSFTFNRYDEAAPVQSSLIHIQALPREWLVQRVVVRGGPSSMLVVAMIFGWTSTCKDLREKPAWQRRLASSWPCAYSCRSKRQHHPATVPRAPPHLGRQGNWKGQTIWSALFLLDHSSRGARLCEPRGYDHDTCEIQPSRT